MNYLKEHGRWITFCMVVWCISKALFISIKLWGIENTLFPQLETNVGLLVSVIGFSGLVDGLIIGFFDVEFDKLFKQASIGHRVLAKSLMNLVVGVTLTIILVPLLAGWSTEAGIALFSKKLITGNIIITAIYVFIITLLLQLLKVAATWIQTNDLRQIFSHNTDGVEEDRIFMFLDMKSSTTHAEKLGPGRFSMLVQDCFFDMTKAARLSNAEIYQYVGDEAVFTWKTSESNLKKAVQHYFNFRENLRQRSYHYRHQYGIVPEFKAGIHHGRVIRTQVGVLRKSIAFHGDAINTASRIQGKCNELGCDLLISSVVKEGLHDHFNTHSQGTYQLRGKDCKVSLFSVEQTKAKITASVFARSKQKIECKKARFPLFNLWLNVW
ncbi:MAG TPA: adenylate/guanylate cyclase domain-containing protein [Chryseolinea sp.]